MMKIVSYLARIWKGSSWDERGDTRSDTHPESLFLNEANNGGSCEPVEGASDAPRFEGATEGRVLFESCDVMAT